MKYVICTIMCALSFCAIVTKSHAQTATLDKTVDLSTTQSGQSLLYTLTYGCSSLDADCIGAKLIDTLPPEVFYISAGNAIISGSTQNWVIAPVYNAANRTVTWDFTTILPEGGLPDGASGAVDIVVGTALGTIPNGASITNKSTLITNNAGNPNDNAGTNITATPKWKITKSVTSGPIYHDKPTTYTLNLCSETALGNLHLLPGAIISDALPVGAVFVSASNGGTHSGGSPGTVSWTIPDTMKVNRPCHTVSVVVTYPTAHASNQTGLATSIPKVNTANFTGTAYGNIPTSGTDQINTPLLPPVFAATITKGIGNGNGITPVGKTNKFILTATNNSTVPVNNFMVTDPIPPQADITSIQLEPSLLSVPVTVRVELNNSGTFINFQTAVNSMVGGSWSATSIAGFNPATSFVSKVQYDYGTVPAGFSSTAELIFLPSYPTANNGSPTNLNQSYLNTATLDYVRPLDNAPLTTNASRNFCVVEGLAARIDPTKSVASNYVTPPAGSATTGNPYFKGSRVKYTLTLNNDGADASDDPEITANNSPTLVANPIGADLLPSEMDYETGSWTITSNTSGETWNTSGNPAFELIPNFNGTGKTLLRWAFTGNLDPNESVAITFNAFIKNTTTAGTVVRNGFAMTSASSDIYCDTGDCEADGANPKLNDYFGQSSNPTTLIVGVDELCEKIITFTVADTTSAPKIVKAVTSSGPYAPTSSAPVETNTAKDIVEYEVNLCNDNGANFTLPNPVLLDLLPKELKYQANSMVLVSNTTGLALSSNPNGATNPKLEIIDNYANTGRQLIRLSYTGEFPINKCNAYKFKTTIQLGAGGLVDNTAYAAPSSRFYDCATAGATDIYDLNNNGSVTDILCSSSSASFLVPQIKSLGAQKLVKGVNDAAFLGTTNGVLGVGSTEPSDSVLWKIRVFNPGNVTLTDAVVVDVLPYIGDVGVQLTNVNRNSKWAPFFIAPIMSPDPAIKIWYSQSTNPCRPEISPISTSGCVNDWSLTPPSPIANIKAVKFDFTDKDILPAESFLFNLRMFAPDSMNVKPGIAWNSIARDAVEVPAQEPNKVGISIHGYDLALRKKLKVGQNQYVTPNADVDFTITVVNQSIDVVKNVVISDYIPNGFTLNDPAWTASGTNATYTIASSIAPDDSININIRLKLSATAQTGDVLDNFAEITDFQTNSGSHPKDWDSRMDNNPNNDAGGAIGSSADNATFGNGTGAANSTSATTDEDDHDGVRVVVCPSFTPNVATNQKACTDNLAALQDIVIPTNADVTQTILFVAFPTAQTAPNMYSNLGTTLHTTTPIAGNVTLPEANLPMAQGVYYIYAIFSPTPGDVNCRPFDEVVLSINPPVVANAGADVEVCKGKNTVISANATGGTGTYTYLWSDGSTNKDNNVTPSITTTYTVTVTDNSNNCNATDNVIVTVNALPIANAGADQNVCIGQNTTIAVAASVGTPTYTYLWSNTNTSASQSVTVTTPSVFSVTVTDSKGCTAVDAVALNVPVATSVTDNTNVCPAKTATLNAGTFANYSWSSGETTQTITKGAGTYTVTVTDAFGCSTTDSGTITEFAQPVATLSNIQICKDKNLVLNAGTFTTYIWSSGETTQTVTKIAGNYSVTVTDGNACTATATAMITEFALPTPVLTDKQVCKNQTTTLNAGTFNNYTWSSGEMLQTITKGVGAYTVTVTDANACTATATAMITAFAPNETGVASHQTVCANLSTITLADYLTGENSGGTWSVIQGTPGTNFDAALGTFVSNGLVGTFTFRYTLVSQDLCPTNTTDLTITVRGAICRSVVIRRN